MFSLVLVCFGLVFSFFLVEIAPASSPHVSGAITRHGPHARGCFHSAARKAQRLFFHCFVPKNRKASSDGEQSQMKVHPDRPTANGSRERQRDKCLSLLPSCSPSDAEYRGNALKIWQKPCFWAPPEVLGFLAGALVHFSSPVSSGPPATHVPSLRC